MNTGTFRSWRAHTSKSVRPLLSTLLLFSVVAEILSPIVAWAAPPSPRANEPAISIAARSNQQTPAQLSPLASSLDLSTIATSSQPTTDRRNLPADVAGLTEIVDRRSAHSATFAQAGDAQDGTTYTSIFSAEPLHYRDADGNWQAIDPAFRTLDDSFTVEHNSLLSRAGNPSRRGCQRREHPARQRPG
jgi:hypothetical protein